jgi:molybdate transport system substrate-binding protein
VLRWRIALLALTVAATACAHSQAQPSGTGDAGSAVSGDVTVFAAASLMEAFEQIGQVFETRHPDTTVRFNFAGSQRLATQITQGAPADVFASADTVLMDAVASAGGTSSDAEIFAGNVLQIAVEPGNPRNVAGLEDLANTDVTVVLAAEEVPAGRYARGALDAAGVTIAPVSLETDVRAVLSKVSLGEADAGIVYASDVVAAGGAVHGVEIASDRNTAADYPAALLEGAPNPEGGRAFLELLTSPAARRILQDAGFSVP